MLRVVFVSGLLLALGMTFVGATVHAQLGGVGADPLPVTYKRTTLAAPDDQAIGFGRALAFSGDTLVVGQGGARGDAGRAHVFVRSASGSLTHEATLRPPVDLPRSGFGRAVAIAGDLIAVGAPNAHGVGRVYIFTRRSGTWRQTAELGGTNEAAPACSFGGALALDDSFLLVSSPCATGPSFFSTYVRSGSQWALRQEVTLQGGGGLGVSMRGRELAVGMRDFYGTGAVRMFIRLADETLYELPTVWAHARNDTRYGDVVWLGSDRLVVGAPAERVEGVDKAGAVYVHERKNGRFESGYEVTRLVASAPRTAGFFGRSVTMAASTLVVGAAHVAGPDGESGLYLFREEAPGEYVETRSLRSTPEEPWDQLGSSLASGGEDQRFLLFAGAPEATEDGTGAVYQYTLRPPLFPR